MHNDRIAEILVEAVTTRARAASILGDLRETAASRGEIWFWACILRTAAALVWRGMIADWRSTFGLALRWVWLLLGAEVAGVAAMLTAVDLWLPAHWLASATVGVTYAWMLGWQFQVGRWVARRAPGRELSACLALVIVQWVLEYVATTAPLVALGKFTFHWQGMLPDWEYLLSFGGAIVVLRGVRISGRAVSAE